MRTPGHESGLPGLSESDPGLSQRTTPSGQEAAIAGVFDQVTALTRVEGDTELLLEIIEVFLDDSPRLMGRIREALKRKDLKSLEQAAHTLKGSVGNFGAPIAHAAALELEKIGREGDVERAEKAWMELEEAMGQLKPALILLRDGALA